jgi:hypothetical protein
MKVKNNWILSFQRSSKKILLGEYMWNDPILEELYKHRQEMSAKFNLCRVGNVFLLPTCPDKVGNKNTTNSQGKKQ